MSIMGKSRQVVTSALRGLLTDPAYAVSRDSHPGDLGLCGPDSASWVVLSDPAALFAGVRALLLQACHPSAIAGVEDHSDYKNDVLGRLQRTVAYVTISAFGSKAEAVEVAARVKRAHTYVKGTRPDGVPYDASDPRLLLWVHIALVESLLVCHQTFGRNKLSPDECDRFVEEQAAVLSLLDVKDGPKSVSELKSVMSSFEAELQMTDGSLRAASFIKNPPLPVPYRAVYPLIFGAAAETLAIPHRAMLGLRVPSNATALARRISGAVIAAALDLLLEQPESKLAAIERIERPSPCD